jgi:thymidine kinase
VDADRYRADRERRRLGSITAYCGPTHSGKTKKLEADVERAERQGRAVERVAAETPLDAQFERLDPRTELVAIDDGQRFDPGLVPAANRLATLHRVDVVVAGWELDYTGEPQGPMPDLMCTADIALKLDDGVCAQPGCRNPASRTQRFSAANGERERFLPVCRRHHTPESRPYTFQEHWFDEPAGSLEVIAGCMFSGKTQELIRRLDQERYAGAAIQAFKPALDDRYALEAVASHRDIRFPAIAVPSVQDLRNQLRQGTHVIGIDEAQFFEGEIVDLLEELAGAGKHLVVAGLELDFLARPFGPMPELMARADRLTKLQASCQYPGCGSRQATRTQRLVDGRPAPADSPLVVIGGSATYQARCRHHHEAGPSPEREPEPASAREELGDL